MNSTKQIVLHEKDLNLTSVRVYESTPNWLNPLQIESYEEDKQVDFLIINLREECKTGSDYVLKIGYNAKLNDKLVGFYLSSYTDAHGNVEL